MLRGSVGEGRGVPLGGSAREMAEAEMKLAWVESEWGVRLREWWGKVIPKDFVL